MQKSLLPLEFPSGLRDGLFQMTMMHRAVAIDGPAASGKSTVARILAERLGLVMVNSGAMYRAVTWKILENGLDVADQDKVAEAVDLMDIDCGVADGRSTISIDDRLLGDELTSANVNANVSKVAAVPRVREILVQHQRAYLRTSDVVMEGRDIGSVVFPETPFKLFIDASEEVRRARRAAEGQADAVAARDEQDRKRKTAPLKVAEGAEVIDSSEMGIEQVVEKALEILRERGWDQQ